MEVPDTNPTSRHGAADTQRAKVERFALAHRFDHVQIEGEHGFGKPEERAYLHAMQALGVTAAETWMIGDNLEWKSWCRSGSYLCHLDGCAWRRPARRHHRQARIIRSLTELLPDEPA